MGRRALTLLGAGLATILLSGTCFGADASTPVGAPKPGTIVKIAKARHFTATGTLGEYYTKQTVTGTYKNHKGRPLDVTVYNWQGTALITTARPKMDKGWWGGYWHQTYNLDQWALGVDASGEAFHLMLPPAPMGSTFQCLLVTEFAGGGNWQNWMDGTSH